MSKNLVCLFNKNHYDKRGFDLIKGTSDAQIYKAAASDLAHTSIYVLDEFEMHFNLNMPWVSPDNFYIAFVAVDESEVNQWRK